MALLKNNNMLLNNRPGTNRSITLFTTTTLFIGVVLMAKMVSSQDYIPIYDSPTGSALAQIEGPIGYYACGISLRLQQDPQTKVVLAEASANGFKMLYCNRLDWS